ncbi:hypothetical protein DIPPA_12758 [Diplonema papillatum]|nr:hypothetical protein DIPPA_12758 [Diplonema papillatum]
MQARASGPSTRRRRSASRSAGRAKGKMVKVAGFSPAILLPEYIEGAVPRKVMELRELAAQHRAAQVAAIRQHYFTTRLVRVSCHPQAEDPALVFKSGVPMSQTATPCSGTGTPADVRRPPTSLYFHLRLPSGQKPPWRPDWSRYQAARYNKEANKHATGSNQTAD